MRVTSSVEGVIQSGVGCEKNTRLRETQKKMQLASDIVVSLP